MRTSWYYIPDAKDILVTSKWRGRKGRGEDSAQLEKQVLVMVSKKMSHKMDIKWARETSDSEGVQKGHLIKSI